MSTKSVSEALTAAVFVEQLTALSTPEALTKIKGYFKSGEGQYGAGDEFIGVPMGQVFTLAKAFMDMDLSEIEKLLESPVHEVRTGAVSIMDFQARRKKTSAERRKALFELYLRRHDRINNWDLVDRAAPYVIGGYLYDKPRDMLYQLAHSKNLWERRTAIVSTFFFIRLGEVADTFQIAEILLHDPEDLIHKAVGGWLRHAGLTDPPRLTAFLNQHAAVMPRTMLRYAIEHFEKVQRDHFLNLKQ